jgi:hypothetical protein
MEVWLACMISPMLIDWKGISTKLIVGRDERLIPFRKHCMIINIFIIPVCQRSKILPVVKIIIFQPGPALKRHSRGLPTKRKAENLISENPSCIMEKPFPNN